MTSNKWFLFLILIIFNIHQAISTAVEVLFLWLLLNGNFHCSKLRENSSHNPQGSTALRPTTLYAVIPGVTIVCLSHPSYAPLISSLPLWPLSCQYSCLSCLIVLLLLVTSHCPLSQTHHLSHTRSQVPVRSSSEIPPDLWMTAISDKCVIDLKSQIACP